LSADNECRRVRHDAGWDGIHGVGAATLSTRFGAICLAAALAFAQLLCAAHKAEALEHKPGEVCDLCLGLAKIDHALVDVAAPPPVLGPPAGPHRPAARVARPTPARELRARSPPAIAADSARLVT
jgi:hypothetical protein